MKKYILIIILAVFSISSFGQSNPYITNSIGTSGSNSSLVVHHNPIGQSLSVVNRAIHKYNYKDSTYIDDENNHKLLYILGKVKAGDNITPNLVTLTYKDYIILRYSALYDSITVNLMGGWQNTVDYCLDSLDYMFDGENYTIDDSKSNRIIYVFDSALISVNLKDNYVFILIW